MQFSVTRHDMKGRPIWRRILRRYGSPEVFFIFHYFPIEPFEKLQKAANSSVLEIDYKVPKTSEAAKHMSYRKFGPAHRDSCRPL